MSEQSASTDTRLAARRRELVQAAYTVFADRGYRPAGVADIVKRAGVSHGTFYNYFDNKRHILDAVLDHAVEHLIAEVIGDDRPGAAETPAAFASQFQAILHRLFDVLEREPRLLEFVLLEAPAIDAELVTRLAGLFGTFSSLTNEYVHSGVERGYLRGDIDPQIAGEGLLALLFSVVLLAARGPVAAAERDRHIAALTDFAVAGVLV